MLGLFSTALISRDFPKRWSGSWGTPSQVDSPTVPRIVIDQSSPPARPMAPLCCLWSGAAAPRAAQGGSIRAHRRGLPAARGRRPSQPSTAAQYFHLLAAGQALILWRKPLVVFTPQGRVRHEDCASTLKDFARDRFLRVVDDGRSCSPARPPLARSSASCGPAGEAASPRRAMLALDQAAPSAGGVGGGAVTAKSSERPQHPLRCRRKPRRRRRLFFVQPRIERLIGRQIPLGQALGERQIPGHRLGQGPQASSSRRY